MKKSRSSMNRSRTIFSSSEESENEESQDHRSQGESFSGNET